MIRATRRLFNREAKIRVNARVVNVKTRVANVRSPGPRKDNRQGCIITASAPTVRSRPTDLCVHVRRPPQKMLVARLVLRNLLPRSAGPCPSSQTRSRLGVLQYTASEHEYPRHPTRDTLVECLGRRLAKPVGLPRGIESHKCRPSRSSSRVRRARVPISGL